MAIMQTNPLVSVVIPLYNKAASVSDTLATVLAQTIKEIEIIVIDDGSTDGSAEIVEHILDHRLRLIRQANGGVSTARNAGILAAKSQWIALIDADDAWQEDHLEQLLESLKFSDAIVAFSNLKLQTLSGQPMISADKPSQLIKNYFAFAFRNGGYPISASSILIKRDALIKCGLFPTGISMGEDIDTWARLACLGVFVYNSKATAIYNDVPNQGSVAGNLTRKAVSPLFADRLPELIRQGRVPTHLIADAHRYANFLLLEYARQLLDRNQFNDARTVLVQRCQSRYDPIRFAKRFMRTFLLGRMFYQLSNSR
jgi:glycosyltransferase involved in cell wall biosynthesis